MTEDRDSSDESWSTELSAAEVVACVRLWQVRVGGFANYANAVQQ